MPSDADFCVRHRARLLQKATRQLPTGSGISRSIEWFGPMSRNLLAA
jgi:hypothetical protein